MACGIATYRLLEDALDLIRDEEQWRRGILFDTEGRRCAEGALNRAFAGEDCAGRKCPPELLPDLPILHEASAALNRLSEREGFEPTGYLTAAASFNNAKTHTEVVALFEEAIRDERCRHGVASEPLEAVA